MLGGALPGELGVSEPGPRLPCLREGGERTDELRFGPARSTRTVHDAQSVTRGAEAEQAEALEAFVQAGDAAAERLRRVKCSLCGRAEAHRTNRSDSRTEPKGGSAALAAGAVGCHRVGADRRAERPWRQADGKSARA